MRQRPVRRRRWALAALAAASVSLLVPAEAPAVRAFKLGTPQIGDMSVARVLMRITPRARRSPAPSAARLGLRVANARRLPRNVRVAGRLRRIGRSNRYIARVFVLHTDPARVSKRGQASQAIDAKGTDFWLTFPAKGVDLLDKASDVNVITEPNVPPQCFLPQSDQEWRGFTPLVNLNRVSRQRINRMSQAAVRFLCARPVPSTFPGDFGTLEPVPAFAGVHRPFEGNRFEHIFQLHGNTDVGAFGIDPPDGGEFTNCTGPCFVDSGRANFFGPFRAGQDIEVNARAIVPIPDQLNGTTYEGDGTGLFGGVQRRYRLDLPPRF